MSLPEQTSLDFTIKYVLPPAIHFYMGKINELVFPTRVVTFLLTFIFCSLFRQVSFTKYTLNILSYTEQYYYKKRHISSTFETLKMQTFFSYLFHHTKYKETLLLIQQWNNMIPRCPYGICADAVANNHNVVCCDVCNLWVHIKCNSIIKFCYRKLQQSHEPWYCQKCIKQVLCFSELNY